ncbi:unnamed protein product [Penicillium camemberti]|uniref:Str. FM013 n=1 Tax=Penicillium camemberti (strain FM 013) TaxID=1429867 RepID=A0A0G4PNN5_PENC3|nr:unnamed protein product [Penicillium camemberti]
MKMLLQCTQCVCHQRHKLHKAQEGKSNRQYQNMQINLTPFPTAMPAHHCIRCLSSN